VANHLGLTRARTQKRPISSGLSGVKKCGAAAIPVLEIVYANRLQKCCEESRLARWRACVLDASRCRASDNRGMQSPSAGQPAISFRGVEAARCVSWRLRTLRRDFLHYSFCA